MTADIRSDGQRVLALSGDIDLANADEISARGIQLIELAAPGEQVIVDCSAVEFMDSSGLSALVRLRRRAENERVRLLLRGVPVNVMTLLTVAGLSDAFPVIE